jgi:hypothetical protein
VALSGKAYNINDLVIYKEERKLYYPKDSEEFEKLGRTDIDFEESRAGELGSPLRWPSSDNEKAVANLDSKVFVVRFSEGRQGYKRNIRKFDLLE